MKKLVATVAAAFLVIGLSAGAAEARRGWDRVGPDHSQVVEKQQSEKKSVERRGWDRKAPKVKGWDLSRRGWD